MKLKTLFLILFLSSTAISQWRVVWANGYEQTGTSYSGGGSNTPNGYSITQYGGHKGNGSARSGVAAGLYNGGASNLDQDARQFPETIVPPIHLAFWIRLSASPTLPDANSRIMILNDGVNQTIDLWWKTDGRMALGINAAIVATSANVITAANHILVTVDSKWTSSNDTTTMKIYSEGGTETLTSYLALNNTPSWLDFGWFNFQLDPASLFFIDDIVYYDKGGSSLTTIDDSTMVLYIPPVSDSVIAPFTLAGGGTTNLWSVLDNTPPLGADTAGEGATTQILTSSTTTDSNAVFNLQKLTDYRGVVANVSNEPIPTRFIVRAAIPLIRTGQHLRSSTTNGRLQLSSNPASTVSTFAWAQDSSFHLAEGVAATQKWGTYFGTPVYYPTINWSTTTGLSFGRATSTSVKLDVDQVGMLILVGDPESSTPSGRTQTIDN